MEKFLTSQQTAEMLNISEATLRNWRCTQRNDIPYIKIGSLVRYRLNDIEDFINSHRHNGQLLLH